jgi:hypothetical protein
MADQDQGGLVFAIEREQQVADGGTGALVQVPGGLIGEQQLRPVNEGSREGDTLLSPPEVDAGVMQALAEPDVARHLPRVHAHHPDLEF